MSGLVDRHGLRLVPTAPPTGFYTATECPTCGNPIFFHGGGKGSIMDAMGGEREVTVEPALYTTCLCDMDATKMNQPRIPPVYDVVAERASVDILFEQWHTMLAAQKQRANLKLVAKDGEVVDETVSTEDPDHLG